MIQRNNRYAHVPSYFKMLVMFVAVFVSATILVSPIQAQAKTLTYQNGRVIAWTGKNNNVIIGECTAKLISDPTNGDKNQQTLRLTMPDDSTVDVFCQNKENVVRDNAQYHFVAFPSDDMSQEDMDNLYNSRESNKKHDMHIDVSKENLRSKDKKGSYVIYINTSDTVALPESQTSSNETSIFSPQHLKFELWYPRFGSATSVTTRGKIVIKNVSANPGLTNDNPNYSLEGAVFGVYCGDPETRVATLTTDASGSTSYELDAGPYWVKKLANPKGFQWFDWTEDRGRPVGITAEETSYVEFTAEPDSAAGSVPPDNLSLVWPFLLVLFVGFAVIYFLQRWAVQRWVDRLFDNNEK